MKKWIWVLVIVILVWNLIISSQLIQMSTSTVRDGSTITVQNEVNNYATEVTKTAEDAKVSLVSIYANDDKVASGVVYASVDDDIYIFSTADIVENMQSVSVRFDSGAMVDGTIVGVDNITGLSLIKCTPNFNVSAMKLGDSSKVNEGEYVITIGGRRKETESATISFGIISEPAQIKTNSSSYWVTSVLETNANVNEQTVGGALLNVGGEMIGILINRPNTGSNNMGYAVGINEVKHLYSLLSKDGAITRGSLGIVGRSISSLEPYQKSERNIRLDTNTGVIISSIITSSPADGIFEEGDILLSMDNSSIRDIDDLMTKLYNHSPNDSVEITYSRDGIENTVTVVLK